MLISGTNIKTINGQSVLGSGNIEISDATAVKLTGNETIAGIKTFSSAISGSITGNAATATKLATARTINGVNFDGTANIVAPTNLAIGTRTATAVPIESSTGTNASIPAVTTALAGVMSSADKVKLDGIATGATANTGTVTSIATSGAITGGTITSTGTISHSTADGYLHVPATGTTNNGKVLTAGATAGSLSWVAMPSAPVTSVAGKTGAVTLVKGDVGLGSVDNTADSAKNVLSATKLTTARTINGVSFDGTANITISDATAVKLTGNETIAGTKTFSSNPISTATQSTATNALTRKDYVDTKAPVASPTFTGTVTLPATTSIGNVSSTELGYLDGVTSSIQTQLNTKLGTNSQTFTASGTFTVPANVTRILVYVARAGGGGSGGGKGSTTGGDGGGGGASVFSSPIWINTTPGSTFTVIIGAGGAGGAGGTSEVNGILSGPGGIGGLTSFGLYKFQGAQYQASGIYNGTSMTGSPYAIGAGGNGGASGNGTPGSESTYASGAAGGTATYVGSMEYFLPFTFAGGGIANSGGPGAGATSDANNGSAGVASSGANGGAGGAGGAGKVIVYW